MPSARMSKSYRELVNESHPPAPEAPPSTEAELDKLVALREREAQAATKSDSPAADPIQNLRETMVTKLVPTFVELVDKYSKSGISMELDASNFLDGGREIRLDFAIGEHRIQLLGTVTTEAIAFHETRYAPNVHGELLSGPMLRLRGLCPAVFREFICERLCALLRAAMRPH